MYSHAKEMEKKEKRKEQFVLGFESFQISKSFFQNFESKNQFTTHLY